MRNPFAHLILAVALAFPPAVNAADLVRVRAVVNAETAIYPGEAFQYSIVVEGGAKPTRIDISSLKEFDPVPVGDGTSYNQINDQVTISYSSNYQITAKEAGTMHLPAVTVVVGGKTYTTNAVDVTVSKPGSTDRMSVEFTVSDPRCYAGQPIVMTVRWIVSARWQNVAFDVPVFDSPDFLIEEAGSYRANPPEQNIIDGVPTTVKGVRRSIKGMDSEVYTFIKVLIPQRAGRIRLDPVVVSTDLAVGRVRTNSVFNPYSIKYERVSVQSEPVELEVLAVPEDGKPAEFYGLVGEYTISASAAPTKISVGDPITLTIRIGGNPYLKPVQWPDLERVPDLAANFKIPAEKASPTLEGGQKVFTQTLRANSEAVTQVPPIPLAFFDSKSGKYVVARTEPISLEVAPTRILTNADVEAASPGSTSGDDGVKHLSPVQAIRQGLSANYYGPEVLTDQQFSPAAAILNPGYAAVWSIPFAALVVSAVVRLAGRTSPESLARKRRRQAAGAALRRLKSVASADDRQRPEQLLDAMKSYIGDRFDRVAASLTADDCRDVVARTTNDATLASRFRDLIAACEGARYASLAADVGAGRVREAEELIDAIEKRLRR